MMQKVYKVGVGLLSVAVASLAFINAASETRPSMAPNLLFMRSSINGEALETVANAGYRAAMENPVPGQPVAVPAEIVDIAEDSFAVDALATESIRVLLLANVQPRDEQLAQESMNTLFELDLRDSITTVWLVQNAAENGDAAAAITKLDALLSAHARLRDGAMPGLVMLLSQPGAHDVMARALGRGPNWEMTFWNEYVSNQTALPGFRTFMSDAGLSVDRLSSDQRRALYENLREARLFDDLFALAAEDPDLRAGDGALTEGEFVEGDDGNPFGWSFASSGTFATRVPRGSDDLMIDARSEARGTVAGRVVEARGPSTLSISLVNPLPEGTVLDLEATCAAIERTSEVLGEIELRGEQVSGSTVVEPGDCAHIELALSFVTREVPGGEQIVVDHISLRPNQAQGRAQ
ncbi:hypothetical protein [Aurantiacibacter sp. D1-12]|uniref:hypothetical protein n=1 Tax=Aurantiacibacter sp. D1-12 TaxID=2993658 RepID=UPI00237D0BCB|nr:hypothetical protein [Aurantiacibacter sp. D1-12]MDE1466888.1 hypothetical protein [Aurantiacibacter sp. D1-12]